MSDTAAKPRPQFRNIGLAQVAFSYRLPLAGKLSILHRISGILLFLCLPLVIVPLFAASVAAPQSFAWIASIAANPIVKLVFLVLIWGYLHHFCAGLRFLALDFHMGLELETARLTSKIVLGVSMIATAIIGVTILW